MRLNLVRAVFFKELREMLRDRRSLAVMFGLPLVLYPLLAIGIATLGSNKKKELTERPAKVALTDRTPRRTCGSSWRRRGAASSW